jgi:hypothetical protein
MQSKVSTTKVKITKLHEGFVLDYFETTDGLVRKEAVNNSDDLYARLIHGLTHEVRKLDKTTEITIVIGSEMQPPI